MKLIYRVFAKLLTWMVLHAPLRRHAMGCRPNGLIHIQQVRSTERFNRTLLDEWAYAHPYATETRRRAAHNHHRCHTAISGPPASRVPHLAGQYN